MIETISTYSNAREFLRAWIEFKKSKRSGFSMRRLCALLELRSPSYLSLVLDGKRSLTVDLGLRLSKQMGLKDLEKKYFMSLIEAEAATSDRDSEVFQKKVLRERRNLKTKVFHEDQSALVEEWYHLLVRELTLLDEFEFCPEYVVQKLAGLISIEEAERSLRLLVDHGLIEKVSGASGSDRWTSTDKVLDTGDTTFERGAMQRHHAATLKKWSESLANLNPSEQELGLLHIPISSEKIPELQKRIRHFQDELIGWLVDEKNPDRVVQVGTYLISFDK